jgi:phage head maturation protease
MKMEIRADGLHINGYVNVPGRESRPVITPRGKVIEIVEQRAFQRAIEKAAAIELRVDHERAIATTADGTLKVYEDAVGLRAESIITDPQIIEAARQKKLKGWSFDMRNVKDEIEERAGQLPIRRIKSFEMSEITLAVNRMPVYSSMSIEVRADAEIETELRAGESEITVVDTVVQPVKAPDLSAYRHQINKRMTGK